MTDDNDNPTLAEIADRGEPINGRDRLLLMHPWNVVHPQPPEPPPVKLRRYRLTVRHNHEKIAGSDQLVSAQAECHDMDQLLDLSDQLTLLNYTFMRLELIDDGDRDLGGDLHP